MEKLPDATKGQPRFVLRRLAWYYARIWIEVTPAAHALVAVVGASTNRRAPGTRPRGRPRRSRTRLRAASNRGAWLAPPASWRAAAAQTPAGWRHTISPSSTPTGSRSVFRCMGTEIVDDGFSSAARTGPARCRPGRRASPCTRIPRGSRARRTARSSGRWGHRPGAGDAVRFARRARPGGLEPGGSRPRGAVVSEQRAPPRPRLAAEAQRRFQPVPRVRCPTAVDPPAAGAGQDGRHHLLALVVRAGARTGRAIRRAGPGRGPG